MAKRSAFDEALDLVSKVKNRATGVVGNAVGNFNKPITAHGIGYRGSANQYFNPTSNAGVNFWSSPVAQGLGKAQQFVENPPQFNFAQNVKNPVRRFGAEIVQGVLNQPAQSLQAGGRIGKDIREGATTPTRFIGNAAEAAMFPLMFVGGGVVGSTVKSAVKETFKQAVKQGIKTGAKYGGGFGLLSGLSENRNAESVTEQFVKAIPSTLLGVGTGGVLGAGTGAVSYGVSKFIKAVQRAFPKAEPQVQQQIEQQFNRDLQTGRFIPKKGQSLVKSTQDWVRQRVGKKPNEPVYYGDLKKALQGGFIKPDEFLPSGKKFKPTSEQIAEAGSQILEEVRVEMQTVNQADPYQQVFTKMRNFLRFAGEKKSKETGELFREHIPQSVFGQSSDELASSMGITENELMAKMTEGLTMSEASQVTKQSLSTFAKKAKDLYEKLDPQTYNVIRDVFNKVQAVSVEPSKQTLIRSANQRARLVAQEAQASYKEWQNALFRQEGLRTTRQAVSDATQAIKQQTRSPLSKQVDQLKDISGFSSGFRDIYRNFRVVFGKNFEGAKRVILDPFDKAKGEFVDMQKRWLGELEKNVVKKFGINKRSQESAAIQNFGEGKISQLDLIQQFGEKKANQIIEANNWFRQTYDILLNEVNAVRARIYPNNPTKIIPKRQDYYRHFREIAQGYRGLLNIFETPANISSTLSGISEFTKPKSKFLSFAQKRLGLTTEEDAVGGFLDYLKSASYAKNIDPHIEKFRGLAKELAEQTAEGTPQAGKLNNFVEFLNDFANDLAGKTNPLERTVQKWIPGGRKIFRVIDWANTRIKANVILGNLSSSVAQIFNVPQGIASAGPINAVKGLGYSLASMFEKNKPMSQSIFLKERYFNAYDKFDRGMVHDAKRFAVWITRALDDVGSKYIWNIHYQKALSEGIQNPIKYADDITRDLVAGRGIGEVPLAQKSRLFQMLAPFQLEVGNLWWVMKDFVDEKAFGKLATLFVMNYLFNRTAEQIRGSAVTLDPIQATIDALGELDKEDGALRAVGRLAGEALSNIPGGQTAATLYPEYGVKVPFTDTTLTRKEFFGREDPTRFGSGLMIAKGLQDPLYKLALPFGGQQIQKTVEGIKTVSQGYSESKADNVRPYTIEPTLRNYGQAGLFGKYSLPQARESFKKDERVFGEKQSEFIKQSENKKEAIETQLSIRGANKQAAKRQEEEKIFAETIYSRIKDKPIMEQADIVVLIGNKRVRERVIENIRNKQLGITTIDKQIKGLGIPEKATFIIDQLKGKTPDEKVAYLEELAKKRIFTLEVRREFYSQLGQ